LLLIRYVLTYPALMAAFPVPPRHRCPMCGGSSPFFRSSHRVFPMGNRLLRHLMARKIDFQFVVTKFGLISKPIWETQKKSLDRSLPGL
jgi:hypothetical protein